MPTDAKETEPRRDGQARDFVAAVTNAICYCE
jgi:hypothetical protein